MKLTTDPSIDGKLVRTFELLSFYQQHYYLDFISQKVSKLD